MKKNLKQLNNADLKHILRIRSAIIKLASIAPECLKIFCISFKDNDMEQLISLKQRAEYDEELKEFFNRCETAYLYNIVESEFKYDDIIYYLFEPDKTYIQNAKTISEYLGLYSMEFMYIALNYIDDNFPVVISNPLSEEEKNFINFLLYKGSENDYIKNCNISKENLKVLIQNLCENYKCKNINNLLNKVLIKDNFKKDNDEFLSIVK